MSADTLKLSCRGAPLKVDQLKLSPEDASMEAVATAIKRKLGASSSVRVTKQGSNYILNIIQPTTRLSEILPLEISNWISDPASHDHVDQAFELALPHSLIAGAGMDLMPH